MRHVETVQTLIIKDNNSSSEKLFITGQIDSDLDPESNDIQIDSESNDDQMDSSQASNLRSITIAELQLGMSAETMHELFLINPTGLFSMINQGQVEHVFFQNESQTNVLPEIASIFPRVQHLTFTDVPKKWMDNELHAFSNKNSRLEMTLHYTQLYLYNYAEYDEDFQEAHQTLCETRGSNVNITFGPFGTNVSKTYQCDKMDVLFIRKHLKTAINYFKI